MTRLDSGKRPLWTPSEQARLGRCQSCEHHPPTQGHDNYCPARPDEDLAHAEQETP